MTSNRKGIGMLISPASLRDLDRSLGRPPLLRVAAAEDAPARAAEQRDALRAAVLEHGAVLVRNHDEEIGEEVVALFDQVYEAHTSSEPWLADPVRVSASSPSDGATAR
jgi:hypothetical protein